MHNKDDHYAKVDGHVDRGAFPFRFSNVPYKLRLVFFCGFYSFVLTMMFFSVLTL